LDRLLLGRLLLDRLLLGRLLLGRLLLGRLLSVRRALPPAGVRGGRFLSEHRLSGDATPYRLLCVLLHGHSPPWRLPSERIPPLPGNQ
jgi:hypothetical protein